MRFRFREPINHAGDVMPVYVTVPVPTTHNVVNEGLRLRSVRAELIRSVQVLELAKELIKPNQMTRAYQEIKKQEFYEKMEMSN